MRPVTRAWLLPVPAGVGMTLFAMTLLARGEGNENLNAIHRLYLVSTAAASERSSEHKVQF